MLTATNFPPSHSLHAKWTQLTWQTDENTCPSEMSLSFHKFAVVKVVRQFGKRARGVNRRQRRYRLGVDWHLMTESSSGPLKAWPFSPPKCDSWATIIIFNHSHVASERAVLSGVWVSSSSLQTPTVELLLIHGSASTSQVTFTKHSHQRSNYLCTNLILKCNHPLSWLHIDFCHLLFSLN